MWRFLFNQARYLPVTFILTVSFMLPCTIEAGTPGSMAEFSISNLVVSPAEVGIGQPVTISMTIKESANVSGIYEGTLAINNEVIEKKRKTVGPLATVELAFTVTKNQPGAYAVDLDGLKSSFVVTTAASPSAGTTNAAGSSSDGTFPTIPVVAGVIVILVIGGVSVYLFRKKRAT